MHWNDRDAETIEGDFAGLKDLHQGTGPISDYTPSEALRSLAEAYEYWIAYADLDGFRVDTVKHMDHGATRFFASEVDEFAQTIGKDSFFLVGEIGGSREDAIWTRDQTGLDAVLGLTDVQRFMVDAVKGTGNPANYFDLFRNSIEVDQASTRGSATTWSPVSTTTTLSAWVQTLRRGSRPTRTGVHWNWPSWP